MKPWFVAWRVDPDPARAQTIQVVHTAHAVAGTGRAVTVFVSGSGAGLLASLGLDAPPSLRVVGLGRGAAASALLRGHLAAFLVRHGGGGVVACRHLRYAAAIARWGRGRVPLLFEAHEVARREADAAGEAPERRLRDEARVLGRARWVVTNAPGTLSLLERDHGPLPRAHVCQNGAKPGPGPRDDAAGVGVVGSVRPYKDPVTVARAARLLGGGITWVGARGPDAEALRAESGGALAVEAPLPHAAVAERTRRFRTLLLPLSSDDDFGALLTSPLKLWDALASKIPLVAADTRAVRVAAEGAFVPYTPGDPASLAAALRRAEDPELRAAVLAVAARRARTWDDRARELISWTEG